MQKYVIGAVWIALLGILLMNCQSETQPSASPYKNIQDTTAKYVGMQTCRTCDEAVYQTYKETGMGQSWGLANQEKSAGDFSPAKAHVYDDSLDLHYVPHWVNGQLFIDEFRLEGKDTIHKRIQHIDYIVGSGQHTNSHLYQVNGYLYQAPITFYTQKGRWDLAPGFEKGANSRFNRKIEAECITCHNGYSKLMPGSINQYGDIPLGIDCERCHGPGSIHVAEKQAGNIVDTSKGPDYSIVNPRRMSIEQQNNLCQRCHLQGIAVLNEGKSFFDFKPSQKLSDSWHVFMPQYSQDNQHMIMASHVERMKQSQCFVQSGKMSCITCHNPHVTVKATPVAQYNSACISCHQTKQVCSEPIAKRNTVQNNCVQCHMPKNGSIDIPHVAVTDHRIQKKMSTEKVNELKRFIGLRCYNNETVDAHTTAKGYLEFYERFEAQAPFLDSATSWLQRSNKKENETKQEFIRIRFLQKKYTEVCQMVNGNKPKDFKDAWTLYRIGESYFKTNQAAMAIDYLKQAVTYLPKKLDFQLKLAHTYIQLKDWVSAEGTLNYILNENPQMAGAHAALGLVYMQKGLGNEANEAYKKALLYDPNDVQTLINRAVLFYNIGDMGEVKINLKRALKLAPNDTQVQAMWADLNK